MPGSVATAKSPSPLFGPIARYRQPAQPRRSVIGLILRGFGWLVLAAAVLGSGVAGGLYLYTHETLAAISTHTQQLKTADKHLKTIASPSSPAIALVAGYDVRGKSKGANPYAGSNSDTLMLLRADPKTDTLSLLSFPRDLYVNIYCHGDTVDTQDRINSAWGNCPDGPAATLDTMQHLTGLNINYFITLDFHAFKQLVNNLHGVYLNVDRRYYIPLHTGVSAINLQPGYQKLDGGQALSYVRYRHTDSDIYRTGRQQLFIEALKSRLRTALSPTSLPLEVPKLVGVLKHNIEIGKAGGGSVNLDELTRYLGLLYHLPPGHLFRNSIPLSAFHYFTTSAGADVESVPQSAIDSAVHSFLNPDVRDSTAVSNQFGGHPKTPKKKKTKVHKLPKSQVSVLVLNAGPVAGEAANTTYLLSKTGYTTKELPAGDVANAPKRRSDTTIYYDPTQAGGPQAAQQLRPLFGPHTQVVQMTLPIQDIAKLAGNPMTVVAVGSSFSGKLVVHHPVKMQAVAAGAGEQRRGHDGAEAPPGLRQGALPADGPAQDRRGRDALEQRRRSRLQAAQEPARGRAHVRHAGSDRVLADRGEHMELGADPREPVASRSPTAARGTTSTRPAARFRWWPSARRARPTGSRTRSSTSSRTRR